MEPRRPPEYGLEVSADRSNIKDVIKGILHTVFFHRFFTPIQPATHDILDMTLPYVSEDEVEALIEKQTNSFIRQLDSASTQQSPQYQPRAGRGQLVVQFLEKKRKKGWFMASADEETVWENWVIDVTLTTARSEPETVRNRRQMERHLQSAVFKVVQTVNREWNHIPPITTNDANPFPYQILVNPKGDRWSQKMGIS